MKETRTRKRIDKTGPQTNEHYGPKGFKKGIVNYLKIRNPKVSKKMLAKLYNIFLEQAIVALIEGRKVGSHLGYIQIVETENFKSTPENISSVRKSKKSVDELLLGPVHKKIFIRIFSQRHKGLKRVKARTVLAKKMYEKALYGKTYRKDSNEICSY